MIFSVAALASLVALLFSRVSVSQSSTAGTTITTQDLAGLPSCAQNCLAAPQVLKGQGTCSTTDIRCLCSNVDYINVLACCLDSNCSPADQQKAVSFNSNLCQRVGITIPNFLGCAVTSTFGSSTTVSTTQGQTSANATASAASGAAASTTAPATRAGTPITIPGGASAVSYTGGLLLTGTCTSAQFASATLNSGNLLQYPLEGCSSSNPGCCPFDIDQPGPLKVCPKDYTTTAGACCPSGWSVYTAALYGQQTPCYSVPLVPLVAPTSRNVKRLAFLRARAPTTSTITNQVYTLRYPLVPSKSSLSTGAKAGIGVGAAVGAVILAVLLFFFIRQQRARARQFNDASTVFSGPSFMGPTEKNHRQSFMAPSTGYHQSQHPRMELPSPIEAPGEQPPLQHNEMWFPQNQTVPVLQQPQPHMLQQQQQSAPFEPTELPGSTHIHEHHPAYGPSPAPPEVPSPVETRVSPTTPKIVSPL